MKTSWIKPALLILFLAITATAEPQQPPKNDRSGNPVCVVRNDATTAVTIEYRNNSQWQPLKLDPGKDASVSGDHIRVSTTREDKATITVDMPAQAGKKYRLFWNTQSSSWDFSQVL